MIEYAKVKSVSKVIEYKGEDLDKIILDTMHKIASIVGVTLGPGGNPVLIERYEHDLPPVLTKDGVTVFNSIGFQNSLAQLIMESARDSAKKTASEAGDGTTTCAILADSITTGIKKYCKDNPRISPQRIMRQLDSIFANDIEPLINKLSHKLNLDDKSKKKLRSVAKLSANSDDDLADSVMECFEITGDDGNVTITEHTGISGNKVEQIDGFPIPMGYEKSCKQFWTQFINDAANQRCFLENPVFLLYNGKINELQTITPLMQQVATSSIQENAQPGKNAFTTNVVVVAHSFSDIALGTLAKLFPNPDAINVIPLLTPITVQQGSEYEFLKDLAGITGSTIFDPLTNPISNAKLEDLGSNIESFECGRYRSNVIGVSNEQILLDRIKDVKTQVANSISELDAIINRERLAKLCGGIAKLMIYGSSNGETKEKRDRAEDAICAVRGALKHGCLPGGGWTLLKVCDVLGEKYPDNEILNEILIPALKEPFNRLISNCGIKDETEIQTIWQTILQNNDSKKPIVYDFLNQEFVDAFKTGILDSTPAVLEAIRNALSIAGRLGTLGGIVVQPRDAELERKESMATTQFLRHSDDNPANDRA